MAESRLTIRTWHKWAQVVAWLDFETKTQVALMAQWSGERAMYRGPLSVRWSQYNNRAQINTIGLDGVDDDLLCKEDNWYDG